MGLLLTYMVHNLSTSTQYGTSPHTCNPTRGTLMWRFFRWMMTTPRKTWRAGRCSWRRCTRFWGRVRSGRRWRCWLLMMSMVGFMIMWRHRWKGCLTPMGLLGPTLITFGLIGWGWGCPHLLSRLGSTRVLVCALKFSDFSCCVG